jgi:predicted esterase
MPSDLVAELLDVQDCLLVACKDLEVELRSSDEDNLRSSLKAAAVGGMFRLVQDLASQNSQSSNRNNSGGRSSMWASAIQAAKQTGETHHKERSFCASDVEIHYLTGSTSASKVGFVIHGFMTSDDRDVAHMWQDWASSLDMILYRVCWPTGNIEGWNKFMATTTQNIKSNADHWFAHLTSNPWHVAQDKTVQVGKVLARFLETQQHSKCFADRKVILIGHSLGGAIVFQTLLQAQQEHLVDHAICLAGAFVPSVEKIHNCLRSVRGNLINVYNKNDQVLQMGFGASNLDFTGSRPAGNIPILITHNIAEIEARRKILDLDVTQHLPANGTTQYGHSYEGVLNMIADKIKKII